MTGNPWYPRYPQDFLMGTMGMPLETRGAYAVLLDMIYDRGRPIPDEPNWIAGMMGISTRKWNSIRASLIAADKITVEDGYISNARAEREIAKADAHSKKHAENGAKGGRKRAENTLKTPRKHAENDPNSQRTPEINDTETQKTAISDQARLKPHASADAPVLQPQPHNIRDRGGEVRDSSTAREHGPLPPDPDIDDRRVPVEIDYGPIPEFLKRDKPAVTPDQMRGEIIRRCEGLKFRPRKAVPGIVDAWLAEGVDPTALGRLAANDSLMAGKWEDFVAKVQALRRDAGADVQGKQTINDVFEEMRHEAEQRERAG